MKRIYYKALLGWKAVKDTKAARAGFAKEGIKVYDAVPIPQKEAVKAVSAPVEAIEAAKAQSNIFEQGKPIELRKKPGPKPKVKEV
jgi:hypothetical protein